MKKILGIILLAIILRLIVIDQSFWLDEAIGAVAVRNRSLINILFQFPRGDNHPPLYYGLLDIWTLLLGNSEIAIRSLSVIAGVITIFIVYRVGELITKNKSIALLAALLLATSPFHVYYSQEARMYVFAALFVSWAVYFFLKTLTRDEKKYWLGLSLSIILMIFTDYVPVLMLIVFWLYALLKIRNILWWKKFLLTHLPLIILGIFWLPIFLLQSRAGAWLLLNLPAWRSLAGGATFKQAALVWMKFLLGRISLPNKTVYYSLIGLCSTPFLYLFYKALSIKNSKFVWFWLSLPLFFGFIISFLFPAFIYFRFLYVIPAFYILTAWGLEKVSNNVIKRFLLTAIITVNCLGLFIYYFDVHQHREDWKQAVSFIEARALPSDIILFENVEPFAPYQFYTSGKVSSQGAIDSILARRSETEERVKKLTYDKRGIYLFEYLHDLHDPEGVVVQTLSLEGYTKADIYDFNGVGQVIYWSK